MDQPSNELDISSLPPEMMVKIFEYLTCKERLTASLTCKSWYQLAYCPKFSSNLRIWIAGHKAAFGNIRTDQNYRHARITTDPDVTDRNQDAIAEFFRATPLETLRILGNIEQIGPFLSKYLQSMNLLTELVVDLDEQSSEGIIRINHLHLKCLTLSCVKYATFEINCPNLTYLNMTNVTEIEGMKAVQLVIQLQQQLQNLRVGIHGNQQLQMLTNAKLTNLKKIFVQICFLNNGIELCFDRMVNLVEFCVFGDERYPVTAGENLGVLKNLSTLQLNGIYIDSTGFEKALRKMKDLKYLFLEYCRFITPCQSWHIAAEHLFIDCRGDIPIVLPHGTNLKSLHITVKSETVDDIFVQACHCYLQLEKLYINSLNTITAMFYPWGEFRSTTTFRHITNLKFLKELHISRMFLGNIDWTDCITMEIKILRLECCQIRSKDALHLIESIGSGLQQLHLKRCNETAYHCADIFAIDVKFVDSLRKVLPRCRISCDYYERSSGNGDNSAQPEEIDLSLLRIG